MEGDLFVGSTRPARWELAVPCQKKVEKGSGAKDEEEEEEVLKISCQNPRSTSEPSESKIQ